MRSWVDGPERPELGTDKMIECMHTGCPETFNYWQTRSQHYRTSHKSLCPSPDCPACSARRKRTRRFHSLAKEEDETDGSEEDSPPPPKKRREAPEQDQVAKEGGSRTRSQSLPLVAEGKRSSKKRAAAPSPVEKDLFKAHKMKPPSAQSLVDFESKLEELFQMVLDNQDLSRALNHILMFDEPTAFSLLASPIDDALETVENYLETELASDPEQ